MEDKIAEAFDGINDHPYTLISLSDREKFHTGMLAYVINHLDPEIQVTLIEKLWGEILSKNDGKITAEVEQNSIDLIVKQNGEVAAWAEAKFKTTLSAGQLEKYRDKLPEKAKNKGALFALFTGVESVHTGLKETAFHNVIIGEQKSILASLTNLRNDHKTLIILWIDYLNHVKILTDYLCLSGINRVDWSGNKDGSFEKNLQKIKLKGIFEHYRYSLFRREVEKALGDAESWSFFLKPEQFNSHGNSGIEYVVHPHPDIETGDDKNPFKVDGHMRYGLQWQARSLKLSVDIEADYTSERLKSLNFNTKNEVVAKRKERLNKLYEKFGEKWGERGKRREINSDRKFASYTIEKWDIFDPQLRDCSSATLSSATLEELAASYVERLKYLMHDDCRKYMRGEAEDLPA